MTDPEKERAAQACHYDSQHQRSYEIKESEEKECISPRLKLAVDMWSDNCS
jgi:hypothetical protein